MPLVEKYKRSFGFKNLTTILMVVVLSIAAVTAVFLYLRKDIVIVDNGEKIVIKTIKSSVSEILKQNEISVSPEDYISLPLDSRIKRFAKGEPGVIIIKRAVPVSIFADGKEFCIMTCMDTVKGALNESPVTLGPDDRIEGTGLLSRITSGMEIKVIRVTDEVLTEEIPMPFNTVTRENHRMDKGVERVVAEGAEGLREKVFNVTLEDGREISRELVQDNIVLEPLDRVIEVGTVLTYNTARGGLIRYKKVLDMRATAYTASFKDTGKHPDHPEFGITYTGIRAEKGIIAVDPKVIPLGTKVYVEVAGSTPDYGYALAADIGGAIKGSIIDLYMDDQETVDKWGSKRVKVYILQD